MPKLQRLTPDQVRQIITEGRFDDLLGVVETQQLEFKGEPYQLVSESQKHELAKDVSALANADGGLILIGVKTRKDPSVLGDLVSEVRAFPQSLVNLDQYHSVLKDWTYPPLLVEIKWFRSSDKPEVGLVMIAVSRTHGKQVPSLVTRYVTTSDKRVETVVGYFERRRPDVEHKSVQQIHALIQTGLSNERLSQQYENIQETLQDLIDAQRTATHQTKADAQQAAFAAQRLQALKDGDFETAPSFLLASHPTQPVEMRGLFEGSDSELLQELRNPPRLREYGWDLTTDAPMQNIRGRLRRSVVPQWKLLELSREGVIIFLARGDESYLSRSLVQPADRGYAVHPFVLAHCVYVFCLFARSVYHFADPPPTDIVYVLELRNMLHNGHPAVLHPRHGKMNVLISSEYYSLMPEENHTVSITCSATTEPGEVSFRLLRELYIWFGFDTSKVPYARNQDETMVVDETSLFGASSQ